MDDVIRIDALGEPCPIPVVKAIRALDGAAEGTVIEVLVDNETAVQNLLRMGRNRQCLCHYTPRGEKQFAVRITAGMAGGEVAVPPGLQQTLEPQQTLKPQPQLETSETAPCSVAAVPDGPVQRGTVVAVTSDRMGNGDEALGRILLKGFLYALASGDRLPETILFYNSGVMLTTEGSGSLEDLASLEKQGVTVRSCGTCLDYYKRKELLRAGTVTDMYTITETLMRARKVIRP